MKIAYLMNTYPLTSTTFIRREIESLEAMGLKIQRYAVRKWSDKLVDPLDIADQSRTQYLLSGNTIKLFTSFFIVLFSNPIGFLKALNLWINVCRNSIHISFKHFAYLLQACHFYRLCK